MAILPPELENVPDNFIHQLEGLLDLGLNQRGEVNYPHIHLQRKRNPNSRGLAKQIIAKDCAQETNSQ